MNSTLRAVLLVVLTLCGIFLATIFLVNAIHGASVLGYAKSAIAVLFTIQLLALLRQERKKRASHADASGVRRNTKLIAIGLVVGLGGPFVLLWLISSYVK